MFSSTFLSSSDFLPSPAFFRFLPSSSLLLSVIVQPPATDDRMRRKKKKNRKESRRLRNLKYQKKSKTPSGDLATYKPNIPFPLPFPRKNSMKQIRQNKKKSETSSPSV